MPLSLPTKTARKFVGYVMGFGVAVAVGMAPFLGKLKVPGFEALLELFPEELRRTLIPTSSFLMGIVAVAVQFYAGESIQLKTLRTRFRIVWIALVAGLFLVIAIDRLFVVEVPMQGWQRLVVVGWSRLKDCGCGPEGKVSDIECIKGLAFDVDTCWSKRAQDQVKLALQFSYLLLTGGFGALIGLLVDTEITRRRNRQASARRKRKARAGAAKPEGKSNPSAPTHPTPPGTPPPAGPSP